MTRPSIDNCKLAVSNAFKQIINNYIHDVNNAISKLETPDLEEAYERGRYRQALDEFVGISSAIGYSQCGYDYKDRNNDMPHTFFDIAVDGLRALSNRWQEEHTFPIDALKLSAHATLVFRMPGNIYEHVE